ncbi:uncharacterized protein [Rutidosis leptorrhynchoides]|uniref:uncharacterized protein n=1 Tax=Rutidosis leptorrhynchoides TaxID=125765 RepID=UPI003A98D5E4
MVAEMEIRDGNSWCWKLDWIRSPAGRAAVICDKWLWTANNDQMYKVNYIRCIIDNLSLVSNSHSQETKFNRLVHLKINVFAWRVKRKRLSVLVELDRKCIDIDSVLCPCCTNDTETVNHCLVSCEIAKATWNKVIRWWNLTYNSFSSIDDLLDLSLPRSNTQCKKIWEGISWITAYYIWKNKNAKVFAKKVMCSDAILQEI